MITKAILFFVIFYALAYLTGIWGDIILNKTKGGGTVLFRLSAGGCIVMICGMLGCLIGGIFSAPTTLSACIAAAAVAATVISGFAAGIRCGVKPLGFSRPCFRAGDILFIPAALIIALQIFTVYRFAFEGTGVLSGIPAATRIYDSGTMYLADPMMMLIGLSGRLMHIHPLAFVYNVLPAPLILFYYICIYGVIRQVLDPGPERPVAFTAVTLLALWGYQSDFLIGATLLLKWYGLWVFILFGLANVVAVILIRYLEILPESIPQPAASQPADTDPDYLEEWDMNRHRIINARNLAIALGVLAVLLVAAVFVLNNKINTLYGATVNLQRDLNNRCSIYEFTTNGTTAGYLLKGRDGKLTFIGGGSSENAGQLEQFLDEYGSDIDTWYVYGEDESGSGAMRTLVMSGYADPQKVYVIDTKEVTGLK